MAKVLNITLSEYKMYENSTGMTNPDPNIIMGIKDVLKSQLLFQLPTTNTVMMEL